MLAGAADVESTHAACHAFSEWCAEKVLCLKWAHAFFWYLSLHAAALLRALISTSYSHLEAWWILLGLPKPQNKKCSEMVDFLLNSLLNKSSLEGFKEHPTLAPNTPN